MSCGVGGRCGLDLAFLWLWCRLAAVAPILTQRGKLHMPQVQAPPPKKKKSEKMQEQRKAVKQDQILMVCLVIKQSRTFRSSSRAVDGIFLFFCLFFCIWYFEPHPVSCLRETETPTRRKKLTTC